MLRAAVAAALFVRAVAGLADSSLVNVSEVAWSPEESGTYLGSPTILRCANGSLLFSHDLFGPHANTTSTAFVLRSDDEGVSWAQAGSASPMYWATLFNRPADAASAVYLMGTTGSGASAQIVVARSVDCGSTWTASVLTSSATAYSTGPTPVLLHAGRLWRAYEQNTGVGWANYSTLVASAPADAPDLLAPAAWTLSGRLPWGAVAPLVPVAWGSPAVTPSYGWLEGNAVAPLAGEADAGVLVVLRVNSLPAANKAALVRVDGPAATPAFLGWLESFPGGMSKFSIRRDPATGLYVTLSNAVLDARVTAPVVCADGPPPAAAPRSAAAARLPCCSMDQIRACPAAPPSCWWCRANGRNNLTLAVSADLQNWTLAPGPPALADDTGQPQWLSQMMTGFQYADWQFDGPGGGTLVTAVRAAYRGAECYHNSNRMLHQRLSDWRSGLAAKGFR